MSKFSRTWDYNPSPEECEENERLQDLQDKFEDEKYQQEKEGSHE